MQVTVGRIGRPHGIRGDVVVGVRTDEPELRFARGSRLDKYAPPLNLLTFRNPETGRIDVTANA